MQYLTPEAVAHRCDVRLGFGESEWWQAIVKRPANASSLPGALLRWALPQSAFEALRRWYVRWFRQTGLVTRQSPVSLWVARYVLRRKPDLYHFEIHLTDHCNLNCRGCAHFSNLSPRWFADVAEFEREMQQMARLFGEVDQIYLLGGEPLLHPDVTAFAPVARAAFPRTRIYLMTNGLLVTRMGEEFWRSLRESAVVLLCDNYPINLPTARINELGEQYGVTVEWTPPRPEFFRIPIDPAGGHDARESFHKCRSYNNCPIVRAGRLYPCAYAAYGDLIEAAFSLPALGDPRQNSVDIFGSDDGWEVLRFMRRPVPWCANCDFENLSFGPWSLSTRAPEEWIGATPASSSD